MIVEVGGEAQDVVDVVETVVDVVEDEVENAAEGRGRTREAHCCAFPNELAHPRQGEGREFFIRRP